MDTIASFFCVYEVMNHEVYLYMIMSIALPDIIIYGALNGATRA